MNVTGKNCINRLFDMKIQNFSSSFKSAALCAAAVVISIGLLGAKEPKTPKADKSVLHIGLHVNMANPGVEPSASGKVNTQIKSEGAKGKQTLNLDLKGLTPSSTYQLAALIGSDSNLTQVAEFTTDDKGRFSIHYDSKSNKAGHVIKKGHLKGTLPTALNPLTNVQSLEVLNTNAQIVLSADLTHPTKFEFLVNRKFSAAPVFASLQINGKENKAKLHFKASGLTPAASYSLALNGATIQTATADDNGNLHIVTDLQTPADILDLQTVALLDNLGATVISTTLP
jgi:hypothetical protein